jgi:hypothetical protein
MWGVVSRPITDEDTCVSVYWGPHQLPQGTQEIQHTMASHPGPEVMGNILHLQVSEHYQSVGCECLVLGVRILRWEVAVPGDPQVQSTI